MSAPPYMKLFWADYHQDTRHLNRNEHGAYFLLIGEAWNRGGYLPDDDALLARWTLSTAEEWAQLKPTVLAFFRPSKGRWKHKRISEELASYSEVSRKRKIAGKKGGAASHGKISGNQEAIAEQKPTKPEPEPYRDKIPETNVSGAADFSTSGLDKSAWELAEKILLAQGGLNPRSAKSFFGLLLSENRIAARELINPLADCQSSGTKDPQGYLRRCAQNRGRRLPDANAAPLKRVTFV